MRVAVIGASGHIGTWLVPALADRGHDVVAISRGLRAPYHVFDGWNHARHVIIDRADESFVQSIVSLNADVVIDLICFDVSSAREIVDALRGKCRHFIHCGTLWVHGIPRRRPYDESTPREPFGEYGIRKAAIENYLLDQARRGFPATVLHPGHITGPGWEPINPEGHLTHDVFSRLANGEQITLPDDGLATLQHVHAADVASAFALSVEKPEAAIGQSFHVAAQKPVTMRSYAETVAAWHGLEANIAFLPFEEWKKFRSAREVELAFDHITHSPCASIAKAEAMLGFNPRYSAVDAVRDALGIT